MPIIYDDFGYIKRPNVVVQFDNAMITNFAQCAKSVVYFAENFYRIIHPVTGSQLIKLHGFQKRILKAFQENKFNILLASRQIGKTTCSAIYLLWFCMYNKDKTVAILANKADTAKSILAEIKYAYEKLPIYLKQGVIEYNAFNVKFENGCQIIAKATSASALRSESISLLFCDEFAFVPQNIAEDFWQSNYPTLSTGGSCIVVSTPNGTSNLFYNLWRDAIDKKNNFHSEMVMWSELPGRDENWKESIIKDIGIIKFNQEFGCQFLGSTVTLIDGNFLVQHMKKEDAVMNPDEYTKMWKQVDPGRKYLVSIDASGGVGSDYSIMNIFDVTEYPKKPAEQVCIWRRNDVTPPIFTGIIFDTLRYWNNAYLIGETNGLSNEIITRLYNEYEYENIYYDYEDESYGICSDRSSKPKACVWFKEELENGRMFIRDATTIDELGYFEEKTEGVYRAKVGRNLHDDCVVTCIWAAHFLKSRFFLDEKDTWKVKKSKYNPYIERRNNKFMEPEKSEEEFIKEEEANSANEALEAFFEYDADMHGDDWLLNDEIQRYKRSNPRPKF